jgi:hypothetical protein
MDFELQLQILFQFKIQISWSLRDVGATIANSPPYQTGQGVFQTELEVLLFHPVDIHTPSPKMEKDIEFPKVLTTKQLLGKA